MMTTFVMIIDANITQPMMVTIVLPSGFLISANYETELNEIIKWELVCS